MQSVTAVLSTAILDFSTCIQYLEDSVGDVALYTDDMAPYIANPATIQTYVDAYILLPLSSSICVYLEYI